LDIFTKVQVFASNQKVDRYIKNTLKKEVASLLFVFFSFPVTQDFGFQICYFLLQLM